MARQQKPKEPLVLSGNVYCSWNCFTFMGAVPDVLKRGDLIIWSWSGDSSKPSSRNDEGLLRVSVFDGKVRRMLKVKRTRVHAHLKYGSARELEAKLSVLVGELRALKGRTVEKAAGGLQVAPLTVTPATAAADTKPAEPAARPDATAPASATAPAASAASPAPKAPAAKPDSTRRRRTAARRVAKPGTAVQGTLFD